MNAEFRRIARQRLTPPKAARQVSVDRARDFERENRVDSMVGRVFTITGTQPVLGPGEVVVEVNFPCKFIERPYFAYGAVLAEGESPIVGSFPRAEASVVSWLKIGPLPERQMYIGARMAITVTCATGQIVNLDWWFNGRALTNPISGVADMNLEGTL